MTSCTGLYADVVYKELGEFEDRDKYEVITKQYSEYKSSFAKNLKFDPNLANLTATINHRPLTVVQIFFASATYDEVNHDVKVTFEAAVGLIGGTMGLFTGFSVLSGIETIFFVAKFILSSLRMPSLQKKRKYDVVRFPNCHESKWEGEAERP